MVVNNRIRDIGRFGIRVVTTEPITITANRIENALSGPMVVPAAGKFIATLNSATGSGKANAVQINGGNIDVPRTLDDTFTTYFIVASVTINGAGSLTISAGRVLKMAAGAIITVDGALTALGTTAQPVIFTSIKDDSFGGDTNADAQPAHLLPAIGIASGFIRPARRRTWITCNCFTPARSMEAHPILRSVSNQTERSR